MTAATTPGVAWDGSRDDAIVLAVDGGGSKTDVAAVTLDGDVVSRSRGGGSNPQLFGIESSIATIDGLVEEVLDRSGNRTLVHSGVYLSGLDLPDEVVTFESAVAGRSWAVGATGTPVCVKNDLHALLRTGTEHADAVVVICGSGINAMGVRSDGATVRFAALGMISGDWGGGHFLGEQALWNAARSEDGRGQRTVLQELVPRAFGFDTVAELSAALHFGRVSELEMNSLSPVLFAAADAGDAVAGAVVARQAEEIVLLITATLARLDMLNQKIPVILGGGVLAARHPLLNDSIVDRMLQRAPLAVVRVIDSRPIVGAALLCLEAVGAEDSALARAASSLA